MLLRQTIFLTSVGSAKDRHNQSRPDYSKYSEFLSSLFQLFSQELPVFSQPDLDRIGK